VSSHGQDAHAASIHLGQEAPGFGHQAAGGGIVEQRFLQIKQVLREVDVRTGFEHRAGKSVREQAVQRIAESKFGSHANLSEKARHGPPQPHQVITAVRTGAERGIRSAQFLEREAQHARSQRRGIRAHHHHPRMLAEEFAKSALEPPAQVAALLPPAQENGWYDRKSSTGGKQIPRCVSFEPCRLAQRVRDQRAMEFRRPFRPQSGYQPCLGFSGNDGAGKNRHRRDGVR